MSAAGLVSAPPAAPPGPPAPAMAPAPDYYEEEELESAEEEDGERSARARDSDEGVCGGGGSVPGVERGLWGCGAEGTAPHGVWVGLRVKGFGAEESQAERLPVGQ